jgi:CheY-like chemotaxis protein
MALIMVVDDETSVRQLLGHFLQSLGHMVVQAKGGAEALALAGSTPPDLVLLDIDMPGMDGLETLRRLRQEIPKSVVIMVSGIHDEPRALQALEAGARDFIRKPFELQHIKDVVLHNLALVA